MKKCKGKGFTLIETIVVIAVIGVTLPVIFSIILTLMRQQVKVYRLSQVKNEGDYVISLMENTIKNKAITIHSGVPSDANIVCNSAGSTFASSPYFLDINKQFFGYKLDTYKVSSASANPDVPLTSSRIIVSNFSISCSRNFIYSPVSILLSFDICYSTGSGVCTSTRPEEITSIHYQTRIKLRNY